MTISRLELTNFTVFKKASFEFCPGINVLIGENGTGKSHVLKAMYALVRTEPAVRANDLFRKLKAVFRPADENLARIIRRAAAEANMCLWDDKVKALDVEVRRETNGRGGLSFENSLPARKSVFVPPREVLAMYRGFVAAYEGRELDFDETYYDLCKALSAAPLRGPRAKAIEPMLVPLEQILGGKVVLEGDHFFVKQADGETEAHLVAEGLRKIASIAYLVANGSLTRDSVLFWDEPEAGLNPALVVKVHDFLLVHRLSQAVEYEVKPAVPVRFFSLFRPDPGAAVEVEQADTLVDIEHNAILDEFARYYDREQVLAAQAMNDEPAPAPLPVPTKTKAKTASKATKKVAKMSKKHTSAPARKGSKKASRA